MSRAVLARAAAAAANPDAPRPSWVDGFLTRAECRFILEELRWVFWRPSAVVTRTADGMLRTSSSASRVSESADEMWFSDELRRMMRVVEQRIHTVVGIAPERCEQWQATRYRRGGGFDYHYDTGYWSHEPAGERVHTLLLYLRKPIQGGSTHFRELDLDVEARPGRLLVWNNLLPTGERNPAMLHSGVPVARGSKTVLVTWTRERDARTPA